MDRYDRNITKFNSSKCKCVFAMTFLLGISLMKWGPFILKKKNREKDTGILIDNGVEFKPPMQYGQKKAKCDLKTY